MSPVLLLTLLILVPIAAFRMARRRMPRHAFGLAGAAFGAIVAPWAIGLHAWYFLSPFGIVPGLPGLVLGLVHGAPGYYLAAYWGLIPSDGVVSAGVADNLIIAAINAILWSIVYGLLGHGVDHVRNRALG